MAGKQLSASSYVRATTRTLGKHRNFLVGVQVVYLCIFINAWLKLSFPFR